MPEETYEDILAQRNWLANRLSFLMGTVMLGTPAQYAAGWEPGPITQQSPEQLIAIAKSKVAQGDDGYIRSGRS